MKRQDTAEEFEKLLRQLISIQSPYFYENDIMEFVNEWLCEHGVPAKIHTFYEPNETKFHGKNVVGIMDSGKPGPCIYIGGHLDTVMLCEGWSKEPYEGIIEDGYMYGVGALDMKSGCAAIMLSLAGFAKEKYFDKSFKGKLIYHFVSDEEGPYGLGTMYIIRDEIHNIAGEADFAIITEPSSGFTKVSHPCICLGAKGGYNYTIKVYGKSAHAATPELGVSAVNDAAVIIGAIENMNNKQDEKLGHSTPCVIGVKGGGAACSVPDYAEIEVFHHTVRGETKETIRRSVEEAIVACNLRSKVELNFRNSPVENFDGGFDAYCIDEDNEFLVKLNESIEKVCGRKANYAYFQSIGDFNHIGGKLKIPTVLLGAEGDNFHSSDERVKLSSALEISHIISKFLSDVLID